MSLAEYEHNVFLDLPPRPKRHRHDSTKGYDTMKFGQKSLELQGVINVLKNYNDYEGGINCSICGKLYKSKVCFTKHLWEHTIYWDQFKGAKNHDRVLSIQAALILYSGHHGYTSDDEKMLSFLLVTAPHEKKQKGDHDEMSDPPHRAKTERKQSSPLKRRRPLSDDDDSMSN